MLRPLPVRPSFHHSQRHCRRQHPPRPEGSCRCLETAPRREGVRHRGYWPARPGGPPARRSALLLSHRRSCLLRGAGNARPLRPQRQPVHNLVVPAAPCLADRCPALEAVDEPTPVWPAVGAGARLGLAERCVSPPFSDCSSGTGHGMCCRRRDRERTVPIRPELPALSAATPNTILRWPLASIDLPTDRHAPTEPCSPSGLRAGTPDRRGKRGEVAAIFAIITTKPTGSIGELGLWTTSSILRPNNSPAKAKRRNSSSLG